MQLQPIVYTTDIDRASHWYRRLLGTEPEQASGAWTSFEVSGGHLALHHLDEEPSASRVEISFVATEPLEVLVDRLSRVGIEVERPIREEPFGRSIAVRDPDGSLIQINEHRAS